MHFQESRRSLDVGNLLGEDWASCPPAVVELYGYYWLLEDTRQVIEQIVI